MLITLHTDGGIINGSLTKLRNSSQHLNDLFIWEISNFEFDLMKKNKIINACWLKNILFSKVISHLKPTDKL